MLPGSQRSRDFGRRVEVQYHYVGNRLLQESSKTTHLREDNGGPRERDFTFESSGLSNAVQEPIGLHLTPHPLPRTPKEADTFPALDN
jgi:hypothetical protein